MASLRVFCRPPRSLSHTSNCVSSEGSVAPFPFSRAVMYRHVPGDLQGVTVDLDLALLHDAVAVRILPKKDIEPERDFARHVRGRVRSRGLASGWFIYVIVV